MLALDPFALMPIVLQYLLPFRCEPLLIDLWSSLSLGTSRERAVSEKTIELGIRKSSRALRFDGEGLADETVGKGDRIVVFQVRKSRRTQGDSWGPSVTS